MIVDIQARRLRTIEELRAFAERSEAVNLRPRDRDEAYGFARAMLERFGYRRLGKRDKGVVLRFLVAAIGISRKQTERLVRQWRETGKIRDRRDGNRARRSNDNALVEGKAANVVRRWLGRDQIYPSYGYT